MHKKVLITGVNGFVGKHLTQLLKKSYTVIGLDHRSTDVLLSEPDFYVDDLTDPKILGDILYQHQPDYIIHLAAITHGWFDNPIKAVTVNSLGTLNLYEAVLSVQQNIKYDPKIIYISTSEVYGESASEHPIDENVSPKPVNFYAASKASAEMVSISYVKSRGLNVVIARPFTHTGPGQALGFFVPDMISQIISASSSGVIKTGNLSPIRDYSDVRDIVKAYQLLLTADTKAGEIYNICSGKGMPIKTILDMLITLSGKNISIQKDPKRFRPVETPIFIGNADKFTELTGWKPSISLEKTLRDSYQYSLTSK